MNTATLQEAQALHAVDAAAAIAAVTAEEADTTAAVVVPYELLLIPLSKLRPWSRNVRKSGGTSIPELAASIARVGLLQNLTVIASADGAHFEVVAGKRRLAALKLLAKRHKLDKHHPVPCLQVPDDRPARSASRRTRRLKLANVSPRLLADYRTDKVTLDQLMALAITDDHAAQEAAFYDSPHWQRSPQALRDHLTHEEIDASRDALARFVGAEAYVYLTDAALLDSLARAKLPAVVEALRAEGWGWVEVAPRVTASELHAFQRARRARRDPDKAEGKRISKLEAQHAELEDQLDDEDADLSDEKVQARHEMLDRLGNELEAIEQTLMLYAQGVVRLAGAVVSVDHLGAVVVHRGLLRED